MKNGKCKEHKEKTWSINQQTEVRTIWLYQGTKKNVNKYVTSEKHEICFCTGSILEGLSLGATLLGCSGLWGAHENVTFPLPNSTVSAINLSTNSRLTGWYIFLLSFWLWVQCFVHQSTYTVTIVCDLLKSCPFPFNIMVMVKCCKLCPCKHNINEKMVPFGPIL